MASRRERAVSSVAALGLFVACTALLWWFATYAQALLSAGTKRGEVAQCLLWTAAHCAGPASLDVIAYRPAALWAGAALAVLGFAAGGSRAEAARAIDRAAGTLVSVLDRVGALALFTLMGVTFVDVVGRELQGLNRSPLLSWLLGSEPLFSPVRGADELTVIFMAGSAFAVFAGVTWRQEHVAVDLVDLVYPKRWIAPREILINLAAAAFLAIIAWALWQRAGRTAESGELFQYLRLPLAPFQYFFTAMTALAAIALSCNAVRYMLGGGPLRRSGDAAPAAPRPSGG
jgi:TRAP-type C4-dicarboxylate transport system permease small subunit